MNKQEKLKKIKIAFEKIEAEIGIRDNEEKLKFAIAHAQLEVLRILALEEK